MSWSIVRRARRLCRNRNEPVFEKMITSIGTWLSVADLGDWLHCCIREPQVRAGKSTPCTAKVLQEQSLQPAHP